MKQIDPSVASRVPPGQTLTAKWPVLTYGRTPGFDPKRWTFRCFGLVERETTWTWAEFLKLPRVTVRSDIHCVTRWSKLDNEWEGVPARAIIEHVRPLPAAQWVMQHADPDYTTNTSLADLRDDDVLLAVKHNGKELEPDHGGPLRLVLHEPVAAKRPAGRIEARRAAVREHGPLGREDLTGRNARGERGIDLLFGHPGHYTTRPEAFGRMEWRRIMTSLKGPSG